MLPRLSRALSNSSKGFYPLTTTLHDGVCFVLRSRPRDDDLRWGGAMRRGDRERHEQRRGGSGGACGARADFARPAVKRGRYGDDQRQDERHYDEGRREERRYDDRERR